MSEFYGNPEVCEETILDNEVETNNENDTQNNNFGELTKQIGNMFNNPNMQNMFKNVFESLKPKSDTHITHEIFAQYNMSYEDISADINNRILPHLLSRLSGDGLNGIQSVVLNKESKQFSSIKLLYNVCNYLVSKGNDQTQIELYRDRLVGQLVWFELYNANNYYDQPTEDTNKLIVTTMQECASGVLYTQLNNLKLDDMFKKISTELSN